LNMTPELFSAIARLLWPLLVAGVVIFFRRQIRALLSGSSEVAFKVFGSEFIVKPSSVQRAIEAQNGEGDSSVTLPPIQSDEPLPADYLFVNHTSFLRSEEQGEFRKRTGRPYTYYDVRVIVDSYYTGALDRVDYVEYLLHQSYPQPIQIRKNRAEKFLLKELADGEYVLLAKVYLKDRKSPLILQRYMTLWESGPRLL
jgi:hypothetical protein